MQTLIVGVLGTGVLIGLAYLLGLRRQEQFASIEDLQNRLEAAGYNIRPSSIVIANDGHSALVRRGGDILLAVLLGDRVALRKIDLSCLQRTAQSQLTLRSFDLGVSLKRFEANALEIDKIVEDQPV